jgi:hypothetical protein
MPGLSRADAAVQAPTAATIPAMTEPGSPHEIPQATFLNFLGGFASQALMQLGAIPHPLTGERTPNLAYARYTLQVLEVLRDKTAGNRTQEEDRYLEGVLTDLRRRLAELGPGAG